MVMQFAYPWVLYVGLCVTICVAWLRVRCAPSVRYKYAPVTLVLSKRLHQPWWQRMVRMVPYVLRVMTLLLLIVAAARPRTPDERTKVSVEGIGIVLALDVSRSMICFDDLKNPVSRFESAQAEAINFINRRPNDLFGLVLFGAVAATRCPLTLDHALLRGILKNTRIGIIPDEGTALSRAIIMSVRRLQSSVATNNILVLLTDGEPSPDDQPFMQEAIALARKMGIKIYTIGVGSPEGGYVHHPYAGGYVQVESRLQPALLREIAQKTGGAHFEARNQKELADIYAKIDTLERSVQEEPRYSKWYEWYIPCVCIAMVTLVLELGMSLWFCLL